jgi:hypothetical protein
MSPPLVGFAARQLCERVEIRQHGNVSKQADDLSDAAEPTRGTRKFWDGVKADTFRWPRWLIAIVVLLGLIGGLLGSRFHVCKDETVTKGTQTTVTHTCNGPGVADAGVVAIALFIVLLLAPDMSEVGVFGISLKRRLAAAEEKASESIAKVENLQHQLQVQSLRVDTLTQNVAAASSQATANNTTIIGEELIRELRFGLHEKAQALEQGVAPSPRKKDRHAPDPQLVTRLIANWETISESLGPPQSRSPGAADYANAFQEELEVIRAARNTVAHAKPITHQDLREAVALSNDLLEVLRTEVLRTSRERGRGDQLF